MSAFLSTGASVASLYLALCQAGLRVDYAAALLCATHAACIFALRYGSNEAGAFAPVLLLHVLSGIIAMVGFPLLLPPAIGAVASLLVACSAYFSCVRMPRRPLPSLEGQVILLTGCSSGIGLDTARQLLELGATVVFGCRTESRARAAMDHATRAAGVPLHRAAFVPLDLADLSSVRECAAAFQRAHGRCDALVCNAGGMTPVRETTAQGHELNLGSNHLAHWLLTQLLLPALRASRGRVVSVSSALHKVPAFAGRELLPALLDDPQSERHYGMFEAYAKSKLAQAMLSPALQRREPSLVCVSLHPGNVYTNVTRDYPPPLRVAYTLAQPICRTLQPTVADGASTTVYAVACAHPSALQGSYLERSALVAAAAAVSDADAAERLWRLCERLAGPFLAPLGATSPAASKPPAKAPARRPSKSSPSATTSPAAGAASPARRRPRSSPARARA